MNHSENCGKWHGNHAFGFDCQNSTALIAGEVNWTGKVITWTAPASKTISNFFDENKDSRKKYEDNYCLLNDISLENGRYSCNFPWSSPNDLRKLGWSVAVHNDYKLNGENYTFWLMTKNNIALKGEGKTDEEALNKIREQILT